MGIVKQRVKDSICTVKYNYSNERDIGQVQSRLKVDFDYSKWSFLHNVIYLCYISCPQS